ncbi:tautomerase family protein [Nocardiopsis algeriensis]|uniref:tautomerase family protein n=1 Tax=Nocardiopsis algeriensis TaxID=1478215 RepID=UPI003B430264
MPHVNIKHFPVELTAEREKRLAEEITAVVSANLGVDRGSVSIALEPVDESDWNTVAVEPEIRGRGHLLIQAPDYLDNRQENT